MRFISNSSLKTFRQCPRKGYLTYLSGPFEGSEVLGLEEPQGNVHMALGIAWHEGAEVLLRGGTGLEAFSAAKANILPGSPLGGLELDWLLAAFLAWERVEQDEFFEKWEVLSVEQEVEVPLTPNVTLYTRADAALRDRADGSNWILNWKTASDMKDWNKKWFYEPQAWTESLAIESQLGVPVAGCIFLGVWKGPFYQGKTTSRLLFGYKYSTRTGVTYATENNGGGIKFEASKEKFPFGEGLASWISWLPEDILKKHFVESAPQIRQDELVDRWLRQLCRNEHDIDYILSTGSEADREEFFWQNWSEENCSRCPFRDICTLKTTPEEMIKEGLLKPRHKSPRDEAAGRQKDVQGS